MRLRGRGPRAAPSSSSGAGDARRLAPPGRNPFVHELRLSALQKAQVGSPQRCCTLSRMRSGCGGEGLGAARSSVSRTPPLQHSSNPRQGPASRRLRARRLTPFWFRYWTLHSIPWALHPHPRPGPGSRQQEAWRWAGVGGCPRIRQPLSSVSAQLGGLLCVSVA
jgi:hypothetical protein